MLKFSNKSLSTDKRRFLDTDVTKLDFSVVEARTGFRVYVKCSIKGLVKPLTRWFPVDFGEGIDSLDLSFEECIGKIMVEVEDFRRDQFLKFVHDYLTQSYGKH